MGAARPCCGTPGEEVWLYSFGEACGYGSWARGDWGCRSDVDLLAMASDRASAERLGERLLAQCPADDVICRSQGEWPVRFQGKHPHWCSIARDALPLASAQESTPLLR